jgi:hypothetical protein
MRFPYQVFLPLIILILSCATNPYLPEDYKKQYTEQHDSQEADLVVRFGDIDNLGFGWPAGYDPFSGKPTDKHDFP